MPTAAAAAVAEATNLLLSFLDSVVELLFLRFGRFLHLINAFFVLLSARGDIAGEGKGRSEGPLLA